MIRVVGTYASQVQGPTRKQAVQHLHDIFTRRSNKACGFKIKQESQFQCFADVIDELLHMGPELRVIILRRRNLFRKAISHLNMQRIQEKYRGRANLWQQDLTSKGQLLDSKIQVDIRLLVGKMNWLCNEEAGFENDIRQFQKHPDRFLDVEYADLLHQSNATMTRVLEFLEVDPEQSLTSRICKATPIDLPSAIENYEQVKQAARRHGFDHFLVDE